MWVGWVVVGSWLKLSCVGWWVAGTRVSMHRRSCRTRAASHTGVVPMPGQTSRRDGTELIS